MKVKLTALFSCLALVAAFTAGSLVLAQRRTLNRAVFFSHRYELAGNDNTLFDLHYITYVGDERRIKSIDFPEFRGEKHWTLTVPELIPMGNNLPNSFSSQKQSQQATNQFYDEREITVELQYDNPNEPATTDGKRDFRRSLVSVQTLTKALVTYHTGETQQIPLGKIVLYPYTAPQSSFYGVPATEERKLNPEYPVFKAGNTKVTSVGLEKTELFTLLSPCYSFECTQWDDKGSFGTLPVEGAFSKEGFCEIDISESCKDDGIPLCTVLPNAGHTFYIAEIKWNLHNDKQEHGALLCELEHTPQLDFTGLKKALKSLGAFS